MKYFIFSLLSLIGCSMNSFTKVGDASVCLVNYRERIIYCQYESIAQCREQYGKTNDMNICFLKKDLKLKGGN